MNDTRDTQTGNSNQPDLDAHRDTANLANYPHNVCVTIDRLGITRDSDRAVAAAIHLASGHNLLYGVDITWRRLGNAVIVELADGRRSFIRGNLNDIATHTFELAQPDTLFNLDGNLGALVTVRQSGAYQVAFGATEIFAVAVLGDDPDSIVAYLDMYGTADLAGNAPVGACDAGGSTLLVDGDNTCVRIWKNAVTHNNRTAPLPAYSDYEQVGNEIGDMIGYTLDDTVMIGSRIPGIVDIEYLYSDGDQWELVIPTTVANDLSYSAGCVTGDALILPHQHLGNHTPQRDRTVPDRWTYIEACRTEPGLIAEHAKTGIRALIRRAS